MSQNILNEVLLLKKAIRNIIDTKVAEESRALNQRFDKRLSVLEKKLSTNTPPPKNKTTTTHAEQRLSKIEDQLATLKLHLKDHDDSEKQFADFQNQINEEILAMKSEHTDTHEKTRADLSDHVEKQLTQTHASVHDKLRTLEENSSILETKPEELKKQLNTMLQRQAKMMEKRVANQVEKNILSHVTHNISLHGKRVDALENQKTTQSILPDDEIAKKVNMLVSSHLEHKTHELQQHVARLQDQVADMRTHYATQKDLEEIEEMLDPLGSVDEKIEDIIQKHIKQAEKRIRSIAVGEKIDNKALKQEVKRAMDEVEDLKASSLEAALERGSKAK